MTAVLRTRKLMRYDGRAFMGTLKITERRCGKRIARVVTAKDSHGKSIGNFKTQKAALAAIDGAFEKHAMRGGVNGSGGAFKGFAFIIGIDATLSAARPRDRGNG